MDKKVTTLGGAKENEVYVVPESDAAIGWALSGVFFRDSVYFDRWAWDAGGALRLAISVARDTIEETHAIVADDQTQTVGLHRLLTIDGQGLDDRWTLTNLTNEIKDVVLKLEVRARMVDLFVGRRDEWQFDISPEPAGDALAFVRVAEDGVCHRALLSSSSDLPAGLTWRVTLAPRGTEIVSVRLDIDDADADDASLPPLPSYAAWRQSFDALRAQGPHVRRAVDDLRALLLRTRHGPYPAAGIPVFVNHFGRDALITGLMLLEWRPDVLRAVLEFLAEHQGRVVDPFREEEPGKILHEVRRGELSRTGRVPFGRYYGSVDATPLFLMAAGAHADAGINRAFDITLLPAVEAATDWLVKHLEGPSGLATFESSGSGLTVQSWKDSANSMVDEMGQRARQPLAVAEVQGYAFAALIAAARLLPARESDLLARADVLREAFHRRFWLPELGSYAMALDADSQPLRVLSSDPGHLLWCGIVPEDIAPVLVRTLLSPPLWSGWGLRTLGSDEVAYNPVSYHNGSVWPHDTGLFAMGLARYGFTAELLQVARALLDLAAASPRHQAPELISGYPRIEDESPIPYTHANVPQAWAAATVVRMAAFLEQYA